MNRGLLLQNQWRWDIKHHGIPDRLLPWKSCRSYTDWPESYLHQNHRHPCKFLLWTEVIYVNFGLHIECVRGDASPQLNFRVRKRAGGYYYLCQREHLFWIIFIYKSIYLCILSSTPLKREIMFIKCPFIFRIEVHRKLLWIVVIIYVWVARGIGIS